MVASVEGAIGRLGWVGLGWVGGELTGSVEIEL